MVRFPQVPVSNVLFTLYCILSFFTNVVFLSAIFISGNSVIVRKLRTFNDLLKEHGPTRDDIMAWAKKDPWQAGGTRIKDDTDYQSITKNQMNTLQKKVRVENKLPYSVTQTKTAVLPINTGVTAVLFLINCQRQGYSSAKSSLQ